MIEDRTDSIGKETLVIPLKYHNVADYVLGGLLMVSPWLFNLASIEPARNILLITGGLLLVYSALTNYHFSLAKILPLEVHMTLDAGAGLILILAPVLFGYRELLTEGQYAVHMVLGLTAIGLVALTRPRTEAAKTPAERAAISHTAYKVNANDRPLPH